MTTKLIIGNKRYIFGRQASFNGSGLFVFMSQCGNNNELALQQGGSVCTT